MFGYVRPSDDRLSAQDREVFHAAYCGLCHTLGQRYGLAGRMILNYDLTFLAMVLSEGAGETCGRRCAVHPLQKRSCAACDPALDTAADMSVILSYWQLRDGVADHGLWGGLKYRIASALLRPAYRKARENLPWFDRGTQEKLSALAALEAEKCPSLDAPADAFASLLSLASQQVGDTARRRVTEQLLYHLGRWVYLIDAADDLKKDVTTGGYNPLALCFATENGALNEADRQSLAVTLDGSVRAMAAAFELLDETKYTPILRATVYEGLYAVGAAVLNGTFRKRRKRKEPIRKADTDYA